jgi:diguanylate cyclase (GGDEF)-like protein
MISLKKYLDSTTIGATAQVAPEAVGVLPAAIDAYRSALFEMGGCSLGACPALGEGLKRSLCDLGERLSTNMSSEAVVATDRDVQQQLQNWGRRTALHYRQKTDEVKGLLIVMARTAESVGKRGLRCAGQINDVTSRLEKIASLEDLTAIRTLIEKSAGELKTSVARMAAEGKAAIEHLRAEVSVYQARLDEAEEISSRDALTGLRSRLYAECQIVRRIDLGNSFCVAILDIDGFKRVNDEHGHLVGDELLKQFSAELVSICRSTDVIARWGGDEFLVLMDCNMQAAGLQVERLRDWVCGKYKVPGSSGTKHLNVHASIGLARQIPGEAMKLVLDRADTAMYQDKAASHAAGIVSRP